MEHPKIIRIRPSTGATDSKWSKKQKKKKGEMIGVYFRFLSAQNATTPTTAIMTTAMMANSVAVKAKPSVGSGSIGPPAAAAGPTSIPVAADELP